MKKSILWGIGALAAATFFVSCSSEFDFGGESSTTGRIALTVDLDTEAITSRSADPQSQSAPTRAEAITASDLSLRLSKKDGSKTWNYDKVSDFPADEAFGIGDYTLEAYYGDGSEQGFDLPYYYGSQDLKVTDGNTTKTSLTATLANSMFTIKYTDAFMGYMANWSASVNGVEYTQGEERPVYVTAGETTIKISVTKPNGLGAEFTLDPVQAEPRYHYTVTVDVNGGNVGDASLSVTFDENLAQEDVEIDLSDKVLSTPAPELTAEGFNDNEAIEVVGGVNGDASYTMNLVALAGIKEATLRTDCASLIAKGWPAEIDLVSADQGVQTTLSGLGLNVLGLWKNVGEMAVVDFSNVPKYIASSEVPNTFTLTVKDKLMRESDPVSLVLNVQDIKVELAAVDEIYVNGEPVTVQVGYNASASSLKENLAVEYKSPVTNTFRAVEIAEISEGTSRAMADYVVSVIAPEIDGPLTLRAKCGNSVSNEITINPAPLAIEAIDYNVYTNHMLVNVISRDGTPVPAIGTWKIFVDGTATEFTEQNGLALISGLTGGTSYKVRATADGTPTLASTITTEAAAGVPNGDFEELSEAYNRTVNQGGGYKITGLTTYTNECSYTISEANGWATTNAKTLESPSNPNTWFSIPSVFNTTLEYKSNSGFGNGSSTPNSYEGFTAHSGDNAMVVRNVAWDPDGVDPSATQSLTRYYNSTVPEVSNHSVGRMFLGTYTYDNGTETYNQGVPFTSRPKALTGWYTYTTDAGDTSDNGTVTVEILAGNEVIATGSATLAAAGSYTQFTAELTYSRTDVKATGLRIMVASSKYAPTDQTDETASVKVTTYNTRYESYQHGATLVVDDFKFVY